MANRTFAFLVIDMLVDFFERDLALSSQRERLVKGINELSREFRRSGQPIIWVRQEFNPDLSDAFLEMRRSGVKVTIAGTEGCNLLPELDWEEADLTVVKKRYSAFFQTELHELLLNQNVAALVVAGINTHACVRTTVIDAYQLDYDIILASECIGSHDAEHHDVTVRYLHGKMARLMNNEDVTNLVSQATAA